MIPQSKEQIKQLLGTGISEVFFKKRDGSIRHMVCTLDPNQVPLIEQVHSISSALGIQEQPEQTEAQQNVVPVWDLEKMAWRSFRVNSVVFFKKQGEGPV